MERIRLALVGVGKIARDQHVPAIAANDRLELSATVSREGFVDGVPRFHSLDELLASDVAVDAVSFCTPPAARYDMAVRAIDAGLHVMLEKPPTATLSEIADLAERADLEGVTLFTSWHSREAAGVARAREWLAGHPPHAVRIVWREDIRQWHPGQEWILGPGGFGVFDPGINALSILTTLLDSPVRVIAAELDFPTGRSAPIAARVAMAAGDATIDAHFDFLKTGQQHWTIEADGADGTLALDDGGARLAIDGRPVALEDSGEYPGLYARFADLVATRGSDVDDRPLRLVADALLLAERREVAAFAF